jgi:HAE1 family hydrophobic/amphiphilic exporter-1
MKVSDLAIRFPVSTAVGVILLVLFGAIAVFRLPIQLTPTVEEPQVSVTTVWPGASPLEVEREIVDEQEEQLKSLEGLVEMESSSSDSRGQVTLTFQVGSDADSNLLKVSNLLEQVPTYPEDADKPIVRTVGANQGAIAWFILLPGGDEPFQGDIASLYTFVDDIVKPQLERVPGVASVNIYGGREQELQVVVDPASLAARGVTLNQLAAALDRENRNYSGGDFAEGKRRYVVRTVGDYTSPQEVEDVVVAVVNEVPVYVGDVAEARVGYRKPRAMTFFFGERMIAVNAIKEPGANVLDVMDGLQQTMADLNADVLATRGLHLEQSYDETDYVVSAISLVRQSLVIGGLLAIVVLMVFLRSPSSTLVIGVAIPICAVGTFLMMWLLGRTLNVISLAGMAFAVGMVVDNSIVVLENIYRHRQMGKGRMRAAADGTSEVWGAVLASTLTTIAVFVPVVFIQQEAGQLFRDLAIAISCGVALSLVVAVTVIPSLSARVLGTGGAVDRWMNHRAGAVLRLGAAFRDGVADRVWRMCGSTSTRFAVVIGLTAAAVGLSLLLAPKAEYLPVGNRNFLFGIMQPPPGYNVDQVAEIGQRYVDQLQPLWEAPEDGSAELPGGGIRNFFFVALPDRAFMGARARVPLRVRELLPEFQAVNRSIPGAIAFTSQSSIFARGIGEGRSIDVEITGPDLERLIALGSEVFGKVRQLLPGAQARPIPSLDLGNPEVRVTPDRRRMAELGVSNRDLGFVVSALVDGAKATDYRHEGTEIDLRIIADGDLEQRTHLLEQMPIATPNGELVTLGSLAGIQVTSGPVQIDRRERRRAITIQVTPAEETPLGEAMDVIDGQILQPMRDDGRLGALYRAELSGSADKLSQTASALSWNFLLAIVITYLLLAALFESFLYPLVIMFSVPLAALGGFLGLAVLNLFTFQVMDILTMLGFFILVGTVVNNAILVVHQSLNLIRDEGASARDAIREATRTRIRPIFMSVMTSVFGMLPLVLFPGAGSELYRGLGSVVVGGLLVSTVFTLFLVPALFSLVLDARDAVARRLGFDAITSEPA